MKSRPEKHFSPVVTFANLNRSVPFYSSKCLTQLESCITGFSTFIATRHVGCAAHIRQHLSLFSRNVCALVPGVSLGHQRFRAHLFHVLGSCLRGFVFGFDLFDAFVAQMKQTINDPVALSLCAGGAISKCGWTLWTLQHQQVWEFRHCQP